MVNQVIGFKLANGVVIPAVALGTWQLEGDAPSTPEAVKAALSSGYVAIDDAWIYQNEHVVGPIVGSTKVGCPNEGDKVPANCVKLSWDEYIQNFSVPHGKPKDDRTVFVTSKVWLNAFELDAMRAQTEEHLKNFSRSSVDLMILHWPGSIPAVFGVELKNTDAERIATWKNLEKLYAEGKCRAIGVSNYMMKHLKPLVDDVKARQAAGDKNAVIPMYNQIEMSPFVLPSEELVRYCKEHKILLAAYSCMGGSNNVQKLLSDPKIVEMSKKYNKTAANICIRWALQKGIHTLPKSSKPDRVKSNLKVMDFELSAEDMKYIDSLNRNERNCPDPNTIN